MGRPLLAKNAHLAHLTKKIRAVLCWECNVNLAAIEHRAFLVRATAYVAA